jgi:heat-inducible transcriptional repressor
MIKNKRDLILETIINEYLKKPEPIGSEQLKVTLDIKISSATIRNYFKKLVEDGELFQNHVSSGRIPTTRALQNYWIERFSNIDAMFFYNSDLLHKRAKELDLFLLLHFQQDNNLLEVINHDNRFLILVFDNLSVTVNYNSKVENFLNEFVGYSIEDIKSITLKLGLESIFDLLELHTNNLIKIYNEELLMKMVLNQDVSSAYINQIKSVQRLSKYRDDIYFDSIVPDGFMAIKQDIFVGGKKANMLLIGEVNKNFTYFFS